MPKLFDTLEEIDQENGCVNDVFWSIFVAGSYNISRIHTKYIKIGTYEVATTTCLLPSEFIDVHLNFLKGKSRHLHASYSSNFFIS